MIPRTRRPLTRTRLLRARDYLWDRQMREARRVDFGSGKPILASPDSFTNRLLRRIVGGDNP